MPPPTNALAPQSPNTLLEPREMSQQEFISRLLPPLAIPMGISAGMRQQLEGSVQGALDPVGTVKNIYQSIVKYSRNPQEALEAMRAVRQQLMSGPFAAAQMMAGAIPMPGSMRGAVKREINAYHGSPYQFEEFDASKIGTGEGAQAYGRGLYFAESPEVAKSYRKNQGSLYTVDLPDEIVNRMIDWDKPFNKQSLQSQEAIKTALEIRKKQTGGYGLFDPLEKSNIKDLVKSIGEERLRLAGVPGIKYLDAGSRGGEGTRNFVLFPGEEKKVKILKRD